MPSFGYHHHSKRMTTWDKQARKNMGKAGRWMQAHHPRLIDYLRGEHHFRVQDLEEVLDESRPTANSIVSTLFEWRMVRKEQQNVVISPVMHELLRDMK